MNFADTRGRGSCRRGQGAGPVQSSGAVLAGRCRTLGAPKGRAEQGQQTGNGPERGREMKARWATLLAAVLAGSLALAGTSTGVLAKKGKDELKEEESNSGSGSASERRDRRDEAREDDGQHRGRGRGGREVDPVDKLEVALDIDNGGHRGDGEDAGAAGGFSLESEPDRF